MKPGYIDIARDALWRNNTGLVQLLGLCPLLAVTTTVVNGIGLGVATTVVLLLSNTLVSLCRPLLRREIRIAIFMLIIASLVTAVNLAMQTWFFDLHRSLGIFVPLIVTNCAILARAEVFASRNNVLRSAADGLMTGTGFTLVLICMGAIREVVAQGTLLADAKLLLGQTGDGAALHIFNGGFPVAALPPGAFLTLGLLIALRNTVAERRIRIDARSLAAAGEAGD